MLITESQYFPPISSIKISFQYTHIGFPVYERFKKMSFQNRCIIPTANGLTTLSIPLAGGRENNLPLSEVRIDNSQRWQIRHWRTITSAYNRSPFFEFYEPTLDLLFQTRYELLHDWNKATLTWISKQYGLKLFQEDLMNELEGIDATPVLPRNYQDPILINELPKYQQVFIDRLGFMPNMSCLDLLFCMGKNSASLLGLGL